MKGLKKELQGLNPDDLAKELKQNLLELTEIVTKENDYLDKFEIDQVLKIVPVKLEFLSRITYFEEYIKSKNLVGKIDHTTKKSLIDTHINLCKLLNQNYQKLDIAKTINQKLMSLISDQVLENQKHNQNYSAKGEVIRQKTKQKHMPPITLNQKI